MSGNLGFSGTGGENFEEMMLFTEEIALRAGILMVIRGV